MSSKKIGLLLLGILLFSNTTHAQKKYKETLSASTSTYHQKGSQTIGLPFSTFYPSKKTDFYGFEVPLFLRTLNEPIVESIVLYPNPFETFFKIESPTSINSYKIKVLDLSGQEIKSQLIQYDNQILVSVDSNYVGVFVVSININGTYYLKKVIRKEP